jgi:hypothetical protein
MITNSNNLLNQMIIKLMGSKYTHDHAHTHTHAHTIDQSFFCLEVQRILT